MERLLPGDIVLRVILNVVARLPGCRLQDIVVHSLVDLTRVRKSVQELQRLGLVEVAEQLPGYPATYRLTAAGRTAYRSRVPALGA